jgi:hypothetical protein
MADSSDIQITIDFRDSQTNPEKQEKQTQLLYQQLRSITGVRVDRVVDPNPPQGGRDGGAFLWSVLTTQLNRKNISAALRTVAKFLDEQPPKPVTETPKPPIKVRVKLVDREYEIEAADSTELLAAEETILRLQGGSLVVEELGEARLLTAEETKRLPGAE